MLSKKLVSYAICRKSCVLWNMRYAKCDIQYVCIGEGKGVPACEMQTVGSYFIWGQAPNCAWVRWPFADFPAVFFPICHETQQLSRAVNCLRAGAKLCLSALAFCRFLYSVHPHSSWNTINWGQTWPNYGVLWPFADFSAVFFAIRHETQQLIRAIIQLFEGKHGQTMQCIGLLQISLLCSCYYLSRNTRAINYLRAT